MTFNPYMKIMRLHELWIVTLVSTLTGTPYLFFAGSITPPDMECKTVTIPNMIGDCMDADLPCITNGSGKPVASGGSVRLVII